MAGLDPTKSSSALILTPPLEKWVFFPYSQWKFQKMLKCVTSAPSPLTTGDVPRLTCPGVV